MRAKTKKYLHTGIIAATSILFDVGTQLMSGTLNPTRTVIVGIVMAAVARGVGAALAAMPQVDE